MSDINDDILNYELGDVDIEDVLAGDEDDLLLSDEESPQKQLSTQQKQQLIDETEEWVSLELAKASVKTNATGKDKVDAVEKISRPKEKTVSDVKVDSSCKVVVDKDSEITTSEDTVTPKQSKCLPEARTNQKLTTAQQLVKPKLNRAILKKDKISTPVNEVSSSVEDEKTKNMPEDLISVDKLEFSSKHETPVSGSEIDSNTKELIIRQEPALEDTTVTVIKPGEVEDEQDDEREERLNPKQSVERENDKCYPNGVPNKQGKSPNSKLPPNQIPRIGYGPHQHRGPYPPLHGPHPMGNISNDYHPHPQYQNTPNYHNPQQGGRGPSLAQPLYRGPPHSGPGGPPSHIPPHNEYGLQVPYRGPRPDYIPPNQQPYAPFNPIIVRAQGPMGGPQRFDQMRPRQPGPPPYGNPNMQPRPPVHQSNYLPPRPSGIPPQNMPPMPNQSGQSIPQQQQQQPPVMTRKILINPNFKHGGWEAAKSQLILDNMLSNNQIISSMNITPAQNDDELLRQQEAFITQNRKHIEKRRYERSPDRDRDHRDRDYSPPSRRDRRAYSREREMGPRTDYKQQRPKRDGDTYDNRYNPKRRRSESLERNIKEKEEEDEETRAYRLEIEKQKAMREKIIREKEERRKKAAEDKINVNAVNKVQEKKTVPEEPPSSGGQPHKLTPLIVKESKIISLKKKTDSNPPKAIPTAKIIPETKKVTDLMMHSSKSTESTLAVIKPQIKNMIVKNKKLALTNNVINQDDDDNNDNDGDINDDEDDDDNNDDDEDNDDVNIDGDNGEDEIDEDALLADSPSPPPTPPLESFRNRRVILKSTTIKSSSEATSKLLQSKIFSVNCKNKSDVETSSPPLPAPNKMKLSSSGSKGIFDRLDVHHQKKIGINESAKRSIQRIVINKTD